MKITIYGDFYHVLARKSEHFPYVLWTIILWKNCLAFHSFPSMFCGGTLTNAPSVSSSLNKFTEIGSVLQAFTPQTW